MGQHQSFNSIYLCNSFLTYFYFDVGGSTNIQVFERPQWACFIARNAPGCREIEMSDILAVGDIETIAGNERVVVEVLKAHGCAFNSARDPGHRATFQKDTFQGVRCIYLGRPSESFPLVIVFLKKYSYFSSSLS